MFNLVVSKVIIRDNENGKAKVGVLMGWHKFENGQEFPLIKIDGEIKIAFSLLIPYDEKLLELLNSLGPKKSWELMAKFSLLSQIRDRKEKQKD